MNNEEKRFFTEQAKKWKGLPSGIYPMPLIGAWIKRFKPDLFKEFVDKFEECK